MRASVKAVIESAAVGGNGVSHLMSMLFKFVSLHGLLVSNNFAAADIALE